MKHLVKVTIEIRDGANSSRLELVHGKWIEVKEGDAKAALLSFESAVNYALARGSKLPDSQP